MRNIKKLELDKSQKQILLGSLLGDGNIIYNQKNNSYTYQEPHKIKQKDYLSWKNSFLNFSIKILNKRSLNYYYKNRDELILRNRIYRLNNLDKIREKDKMRYYVKRVNQLKNVI